MDGVLVDSDVVSYLFKKDSRGRSYRPYLVGKLWIISFMTLAELERWKRERNWGQARQDLLDRFLSAFMVWPYDRALCRLWAEISDKARRAGQPIQTADGWIAATALLLGVPLVTHNPNDYRGVRGLGIITQARP